MPERDPLEAARADRDDLLAHEHWLNSEETAAKLGLHLADVHAENWAAEQRRDKQLFGVRFHGQYLHPEFQFGATGSVLPKLPALISFLPSTDSNWTAAFWLFQPHGRFAGQRPVDVFAENPDAVVSAAREDFVEGPYEGDPALPPRPKR